MNNENDRSERDEAIDRAFEILVDDELEGFAVAGKIDGEIHSISFTDDDGEDPPSGRTKVCDLIRIQVLGKLVADAALMYRKPPAEVADNLTHYAKDHVGVDREAIAQAWRRFG